MSTLKEFVICPYNKNHIIRRYRVQYHVPTCKQKYQNIFYLTCRFSCYRLSQEDSEFWCEAVAEDVGSKSKRRRLKIKERRAQRFPRPYNNGPSWNQSLNEKSVGMDNQQEMSDPWEEPVRKKSTRKNPVHPANGKARLSIEAGFQPTKWARKRFQKKLKKEKDSERAYLDTVKINPDTEMANTDTEMANTDTEMANPDTEMANPDTEMANPDTEIANPDTEIANPNTAMAIPDTAMAIPDTVKDFLMNEPNGKKEYVIRFNKPVVVTETYKSLNEVYIHYPTKKVLQVKRPPKSRFGIRPMMLQRICFEAFMKMHRLTDIEVNRFTSSINENKTIQVSNETGSGDNSSVNEDENKTIQVSNETGSGDTPSIIKEEKKTTEASDGKCDAALQYPKRPKTKKNKKKSNVSPKTTIPYNPAKYPSFEEVERRDPYEKYMLFDNQEITPPTPRPNGHTYPPPYLGDADESGNFEDFEYPAEHRDHEVYDYLDDNDQANENENENSSEDENNSDGNPNLSEDENNSDGNPNSSEDENNSDGNPNSSEDENNSDGDPSSSEDENNSDGDPNTSEDENNSDGDPNTSEDENNSDGDPNTSEDENSDGDPNTSEDEKIAKRK